MGRVGEFEISKNKQDGKWVVNVSAKLSPTGKKRRFKFATKAAAEERRKKLIEAHSSPHLEEFDADLLKAANYYKGAFQLHGYDGLEDACAVFLKELDKRSHSTSLLELIRSYKTNRGADWSDGYIQTFEWAKKQLKTLHSRQISELNADHWQDWLPAWRKKGNYAAKSSNHLRTFLISIFSLPKAVAVFPANPVKQIPALKLKKKEVSLLSNRDTKALLTKAASDDADLVPWFAIALFAGLRPESELGKLDWSDINFEERWIRVGFGNKTDTKRFVDLSDTLVAWIAPFAKKSGPIQLVNHRKRKDQIVKGTVTWDRDITRHTYGSNLEAIVRAEEKDSKAVVLANMGHTMTQTFEQHYRNARTAKQAKAFWNILPPKGLLPQAPRKPSKASSS